VFATDRLRSADANSSMSCDDLVLILPEDEQWVIPIVGAFSRRKAQDRFRTKETKERILLLYAWYRS